MRPKHSLRGGDTWTRFVWLRLDKLRTEPQTLMTTLMSTWYCVLLVNNELELILQSTAHAVAFLTLAIIHKD